MKFLLPLSLFTLVAFAQAPKDAAPAANPGLPAGNAAPVAKPPVDLPADTVVAKSGGKPLTAGQVKKMMAALPQELQDAFQQNPKGAMESLFLLEFLQAQADSQNLSTVSPFKEQLAMQRTQILAQAAVARYTEGIKVSDAETKERYEKDKAKYETAKIRGIYVAFADPKAPADKPAEGAPAKTLTEAEAKAKAEGIVKEARGGAEFADLARKHSDDQTTAAKGGDYGTMRRGDKIPDDIKNAMFALKAGGVSEPLHQPQGFFIIKVEERGMQPFEAVQAQLGTEMKQEKFTAWMEGLRKQFEVSIERQEFFGTPAPKAGPSVSVQQIQ